MQTSSRKRRRNNFEEELDNFMNEDVGKISQCDSVNQTDDIVVTVSQAAVEVFQNNKRTNNLLQNKKDKNLQKRFWTEGYRSLYEEEFTSRLRIRRANFEFILETIAPPFIE